MSAASPMLVAAQHYSSTGVPKVTHPVTSSLASAQLPPHDLWSSATPESLLEAEMVAAVDDDVAVNLSLWGAEVFVEHDAESKGPTLRRSRSDSRPRLVGPEAGDRPPVLLHKQHLVIRGVDIAVPQANRRPEDQPPAITFPRILRWSPSAAASQSQDIALYSSLLPRVLSDEEYDQRVQEAVEEAMLRLEGSRHVDGNGDPEIFLSANDDIALPRIVPPPRVDVEAVPANQHLHQSVESLCFVPAHLMSRGKPPLKESASASTAVSCTTNASAAPNRQAVPAAIWTLWSATRADRFSTNSSGRLFQIDFSAARTHADHQGLQEIHIFHPSNSSDRNLAHTIALPWHLDGLVARLQEGLAHMKVGLLTDSQPKLLKHKAEEQRARSVDAKGRRIAALPVVAKPSSIPPPAKSTSNPLWRVLIPQTCGYYGALPRPFVVFSARAQRVITIHSVLVARHTLRHCVCIWRLHEPYHLVEYFVLPLAPWWAGQTFIPKSPPTSSPPDLSSQIHSTDICGIPQDIFGNESAVIHNALTEGYLPMPILSCSLQDGNEVAGSALSSQSPSSPPKRDALVITFYNMHTLVYSISPPVTLRPDGAIAVAASVLELSHTISSALAYERLAKLSAMSANQLSIDEVDAFRLKDMQVAGALAGDDGPVDANSVLGSANFTEMQRKATLAAMVPLGLAKKGSLTTAELPLSLSHQNELKRLTRDATSIAGFDPHLTILPPYHHVHNNRHVGEQSEVASRNLVTGKSQSPQISPSRPIVGPGSPFQQHTPGRSEGKVLALVHRMVSKPAELPGKPMLSSDDEPIPQDWHGSAKRSPQPSPARAASGANSNYPVSKANVPLPMRLFRPDSFAVKATEALGGQRARGLLGRYLSTWARWASGERKLPSSEGAAAPTTASPPITTKKSPPLLWEGPLHGHGGLLVIPINLLFGTCFELSQQDAHHSAAELRLPELLKAAGGPEHMTSLLEALFGEQHAQALRALVAGCRLKGITLWLVGPSADVKDFGGVAADEAGTTSYATVLKSLLRELENSVEKGATNIKSNIFGCICGSMPFATMQSDSARSRRQRTLLEAFYKEVDEGISIARAIEAETRLAHSLAEEVAILPSSSSLASVGTNANMLIISSDVFHLQCVRYRQQGSGTAVVPQIYVPASTCTPLYRTQLVESLARAVRDPTGNVFEQVNEAFAAERARGLRLAGDPTPRDSCSAGGGTALRNEKRRRMLSGGVPISTPSGTVDVPFRVGREQSFTGEAFVDLITLSVM